MSEAHSSECQSEAHHLQANAAALSSESKNGSVRDKESPRDKLNRVRKPKGIPLLHEFKDWLEQYLPDLLKRRPDLYKQLYADKWHVWNRQRCDWEPINDWRALCHGLAQKIKAASQNGSEADFPFMLECERELINTYNDFARRNADLGFLVVNEISPEVQKALDVMEHIEPDELITVLEEEAKLPEGARTFVRCHWDNY